MPHVDVNYLAVIVAALVNMIVGALWYSQSLFGKKWAKLTGRKMEEMKGAGSGYAIAAIGALVQAWIMYHFVRYAGSVSFVDGMITGFWLWVAFVAVVLAIGTVFDGRPWQLWKINAGYFFVVLVINGGILAAWH